MVEMHQRGTAYWSWSDDQWVETVGASVPLFLERQRSTMVTHRQAIFSVAYLLGDFTAFELFAPHGIELHTLATTVFGDAVFIAAADRVFSVLADWGYSPGTQGIARTTLAFLLLRNRSPRLEDLTLELLTSLHKRIETRCRLPQLYAISRALAHLQFIPAPISRGQPKLPLRERIDTTALPKAWVDWCLAWHEQALCSERTRKQSLYMLLQIGRWLARSHRAVTSPEHWAHEIAADFVRAVDQMKVGDWRSLNNYPEQFKRNVGKPLTPRAKASFLQRARAFFLDLQDHPIRVGKDQTMRTLQRRFNPLRALRTPPAIHRLIGPAPRTIEDKLWLKLLNAAETLQRSDLHRFQLAMYPFELVKAVAITWCLSGLRTDEIRRLRVGCVRWRVGENDTGKSGESLPDDAICFLSVPVNKTGTAFVKPVHWLVGKRIEEWERVRPPQTLELDPKTNEMVRFLFSFRGVRIAWAYFNGHLIPMLCQKANIPMEDAIGRITAHRARSTIASALYNAPEGLTIGELGQWLGHKDFRSTQHYAKLHPTRLAKAISRANRNSRLATVLVDPAAVAKGEPAIFYYLGEGAYCANPAWSACPHRMACLKCPMYVAPDTGKLIEARDGVLRLLQEVPLTHEEKAVAEGDVQALNRYIEKRRDIPAPKLPSDRYAYNRSAQTG